MSGGGNGFDAADAKTTDNDDDDDNGSGDGRGGDIHASPASRRLAVVVATRLLFVRACGVRRSGGSGGGGNGAAEFVSENCRIINEIVFGNNA